MTNMNGVVHHNELTDNYRLCSVPLSVFRLIVLVSCLQHFCSAMSEKSQNALL